MDDLFFKNECSTTLAIKPNEISNSIEDILQKRISNEIEGKCIKEGYVRPGSIKIIHRSSGRLLMNQFNGSVIYNITFIAEICNPLEGMIVQANVININKMGILAYGGYEEPYPLNILLAKQHHIDNEYFDSIKQNDSIFVKVIGVRKEYGDSQISIIGKLMNKDEIDIIKETKKEQGEETINYYSKSKNFKWLSTYNKANTFNYKGRDYETIEHAFNSQKNMDSDYQDLFTLGTETYISEDPSIAKKTGKNTNLKKLKKSLVENWDTEQIIIMKDITRVFFETNPDIRIKLLDTNESILVNSGPGVDSFWGITKGSGENNHGKILMELRKEFQISENL